MTAHPTDETALAAELARQSALLGVLQRVSSEINSTLELEEIYRISLATMDELFEFHHSIILLADGGGETLTVVASRGYEDQAIGGKVRMGTGVIGMVAKKRRMLHMNNLGQSRAYVSAQRRQMVEAGRTQEIGAEIPIPGLPNVESQIAIPLMVKDHLIGVFSVESPERRIFTERDEGPVTIVANQTASAIHIARLYDELERTNALLETRVKERTSELGHKLHVAEELLNDAKRRVEGPLLGEGRAVRELREKIERSAASSEPLLIVGPPGSGKEAVARAIHASSARQHGAFIHVYCPHLQPRDRSSLLGLPSGSTIPALPRGGERPPSKLELAGGGTLYLDGVHELAFELQRDLLQVLIAMEESRARGVQWHPDAQVILATSANLALEVEEARFDPDLWRAVSRSPITVPSLQERLEDVPLLVEHFLRKQARQLGKSVQGVTEESMKRLCAYRWPGNVRELEHVLERAVLVASGPLLEIEEELLAEGTSVGRYRLVKRIGSGGMGEVWLGKHAFLARPAAVKLIRAREAEGTPEKRRRDRFQQEAQVTATLKSPHTVQLYDFGVNETGTFYYVMELLSGMDLNEMVKRFGPLPAERVVMLLAQACRSLAEAHELGLVHRDIKPANLFVTSLGPQYDFLKVLDFGMVKAPLGGQSTRLTVEGTAHGTPAFMAPEIALGEGTVDGRADLYSLGCSAYWMLTGRLVFEAPNPTRMIMDHIRTSPRPPSELAEVGIPGALEQVILRCLEKSPDRRPATAQELRGELESVECKLAWTEKRAEDWWRMHASDLLRGREE